MARLAGDDVQPAFVWVIRVHQNYGAAIVESEIQQQRDPAALFAANLVCCTQEAFEVGGLSSSAGPAELWELRQYDDHGTYRRIYNYPVDDDKYLICCSEAVSAAVLLGISMLLAALVFVLMYYCYDKKEQTTMPGQQVKEMKDIDAVPPVEGARSLKEHDGSGTNSSLGIWSVGSEMTGSSTGGISDVRSTETHGNKSESLQDVSQHVPLNTPLTQMDDSQRSETLPPELVAGFPKRRSSMLY